MKKTILYRLLGLGAVPKPLRPALAQEDIIVLDEGIGGWFIAKHVNGPGKRYRHHSEGFSGCLAITKARVICYTFGKRQINLSVADPNMAKLYVDTPEPNQLSLAFESADFREGWLGVIEFRFNTEKAARFREALVAFGAQPGTAADAGKSCG
jgi:hypothetical protein